MEQITRDQIDHLIKISKSICKDDAKAEDIVQDILLYSLEKKISSFEEIEKNCRIRSSTSLLEEKKNPAKPFRTITNKGGGEIDMLEISLAGAEILRFQKESEEKTEAEQIKEIESLTEDGYLPFEVAREYVQTLKLENQKEWYAFCKNGKKPNNIPSEPRVYKEKFQGYADWLGYAYWDYETCKGWVQENLVSKKIVTSQNSWKGLDKSILPRPVPKNPEGFFKRKGTWKNWGDFLGIKRMNSRRKMLDFEEGIRIFREELIPAKIDSSTKYFKYRKDLQENCFNHPHLQLLPSDPTVTWKKTWWEIFERAKKEFRPYKEARTWVRFNLAIPLGINTERKWLAYLRNEYPDAPTLPEDIPHAPQTVFKNRGWDGFGAFFGTFKVMRKNFWNFERSRKWIADNIPPDQVYDLFTWKEYTEGKMPDLPPLPEKIPLSPWSIFKNKGYKNIQHWLNQEEWSTPEIKEFILKNLIFHGIDNPLKFNLYLKGKYPDAPTLPQGFPKGILRYIEGGSIESIFGTRKEQEKHFLISVSKGAVLKFEQARWYVQKFLVPQGIDTLGKYVQYNKRPRFLPERPDLTYFKKWTTPEKFFGKNLKKPPSSF